jgi:hypothetical protein
MKRLLHARALPFAIIGMLMMLGSDRRHGRSGDVLAQRAKRQLFLPRCVLLTVLRLTAVSARLVRQTQTTRSSGHAPMEKARD